MRLQLLSLALLFSITQTFGQTKFQIDFLYYWKTVNDNFAYFNKQHTDWNKVKLIYQPQVDTITTKDNFIHLLEAVDNELYNGHVFLNTNRNSSNRTVPTGSDLKISWINNQFIITEIREGYNAALCGLDSGMVVTKYNDVAIDEAVKKLLPKSVAIFDKAMYEYAANFLLAGTHDVKRTITAINPVTKNEKDFFPDNIPNKTEEGYAALLETKVLEKNIGYIKLNNSIGNDDLIKLFDSSLDNLMNTNALILDLRETPSGGTSIIARAIMSRFIDKEMPYQKHIYVNEEKETGIKRSTLELVSPRKSIYRKPLIILVGNWTGSMGEGIAIGFDAMKRAEIMGTQMAGLLGEIYSFETPELKLPFSFPCVQLEHVNGQPREDFMPKAISQKDAIKIASMMLIDKITSIK